MADRGTQSGGSGGGMRGIPIGVGSQFTKGVLLIVAAVVVGVVLLQIVDDGSPVAAGGRKPAATTSTTSNSTTTKPRKSTPSTTAKAAALKTPAQLHLLVLNAGAPNGSAASVSATLKNHGYTNQGTPASDPTHRVGNQVLCTAGLTREATTLATLLGTKTTTATLGSSPPPGSAGFDCVALIGG
jgi:hypothetical protein